MRIRLAENFRALFYAPFYATQALGLYAEQGLEVDMLDSAAPGDAIAGLASGEIDVTWAGPMRVMRDREQSPPSGRSLVCFCEVVTRDPFFLLVHANAGPFRLQDLPRLRMGSVSEVVTPWLCLQQDLRDAGIDPGAVRRVTDQSMQTNLDALREGRLDVVQLFEPFVSLALAQGFGRIVHAASERGPTSYTSLIATRDGVARKTNAIAAMLRATEKMQSWLLAHDAAELARLSAPYFPHLPRALLQSGLQRYAAAGVWSRTPDISRPGFARLAQSVQSGGLVKALARYEDCVAAIPG